MFKLSVKTENAAFEGDGEARKEVARILREVAELLDGDDCWFRTIRDVNGNRVGSWSLDND